MYWQCSCGKVMLTIVLILIALLDNCEMSIYPGLRRKPLQQLQSSYDVNSDFLSQLMEENARRRLQQQFEQQLELINMQINRQRQRQERLREERYRHQQLAALAEVAANYPRRLPAITDNDSEEFRRVNDGNEYIGKMYYNEKQQLDTDEPDIRQRPEYVYPTLMRSSKESNERDNVNDYDDGKNRMQFAVTPTDPRFYEDMDTNQISRDEERNTYTEDEDNNALEEKRVQEEGQEEAIGQKEFIRNDDDEDDAEDDDLDTRVLDEYEEYVPTNKADKNQILRTEPNDRLTLHPSSLANINEQRETGVNYHRIKPPPATISKTGLSTDLRKLSNNDASKSNATTGNHQYKLHPNVNSKEFVDDHQKNNHQLIVSKEQLTIKDEMDMYLVALIAGVSAAITVGLLVLGIIWYTFHRRNKAATDIEYPAYGVTGPNKDIKPSSVDRKLAQSAQMYHYQHQKQQIMALENRPNNEDGYEMTYIDSDDDNEEGDYTVYECPGLAPTGEMEVKNPLFLDDTPVTPSLGSQAIAQVAAQQPPTKKNIFSKPEKNSSSSNNNNSGSNVNPEKRLAKKPKK